MAMASGISAQLSVRFHNPFLSIHGDASSLWLAFSQSNLENIPDAASFLF
jgi:hypothetical protein